MSNIQRLANKLGLPEDVVREAFFEVLCEITFNGEKEKSMEEENEVQSVR